VEPPVCLPLRGPLSGSLPDQVVHGRSSSLCQNCATIARPTARLPFHCAPTAQGALAEPPKQTPGTSTRRTRWLLARLADVPLLSCRVGHGSPFREPALPGRAFNEPRNGQPAVPFGRDTRAAGRWPSAYLQPRPSAGARPQPTRLRSSWPTSRGTGVGAGVAQGDGQLAQPP
jgi:hypothetical protein